MDFKSISFNRRVIYSKHKQNIFKIYFYNNSIKYLFINF
jgi:hypothetical protein